MKLNCRLCSASYFSPVTGAHPARLRRALSAAHKKTSLHWLAHRYLPLNFTQPLLPHRPAPAPSPSFTSRDPLSPSPRFIQLLIQTPSSS